MAGTVDIIIGYYALRKECWRWDAVVEANVNSCRWI